MSAPHLFPRFIEKRVVEALADTPAVLIHGPRQCGKTTLARMVGDRRGYSYFTFDDDVALSAAKADPIGFVADLPELVILDEVQRVPDLFTALKTSIDRHRTPGRFILTGSSNVLLVPKLADSLAGRLEIIRLHPLAQCEVAGKRPGFLEALFDGSFKTRQSDRLGPELAERIIAGGYPAPLGRAKPHRRAAWYRDYADTLIQRDVRDLARISALDALPRLLDLAAGNTACLINISELAGPFRLSRPTIGDYITLLERLFLVERLPPWHSNRLKRLIKTPKLHVTDTGLACALLGLDAVGLYRDRPRLGRMLQTFVLQEVRRLASWHPRRVGFHHFRNKDGAEVDIVLERSAGEIAAIEVKAAATVTSSDFRSIRKLQRAAGTAFTAGVLLYDGETTVGFGDELFALPLRRLWETA